MSLAGAPDEPSPEAEISRLELRALTKRIGGNTVVNGIDLVVRPGENVVLLGASGCGKTTTLRMVAGFIRPDSGEIRLDGRLASGPGVQLPPEQRRLGMVFQNYAIWPHKNVFANVAYGLGVARQPLAEIKRKVARLLAIVRLEGLEARLPSELSGGQQQRVALARAIATEPSLLLLDEPLSNLDAGLRQDMRFELKELHRRIGMTILYVTHDQEEALVLGDRIVVMNAGRIEQVGSPQDIYLRPRSRFVASFVGTTNLFEGEIKDKDAGRGRVLVATAIGADVWAGAYPDILRSLTTGSRAAIAVRPEDIAVGPGGVNGTPAEARRPLKARLTSAAFLGSRYELHLDINGQPCRAQARSLTDFQDGVGEVHIDPGPAWVVP